MLRRLALRDFVSVPALELDFHAGFSVLTGETGAGKSILVDALQLALGSRGDASVVREGASRAEVSVEFDSPTALVGWLDQAGFSTDANAESPAPRARWSMPRPGWTPPTWRPALRSARPPPMRWPVPASGVTRLPASVTAWPGKSVSWTSWPLARVNGPSCRPSTSAWPMPRP